MSFNKLLCYFNALLGATGLALHSTGEEDAIKAVVYAVVLAASLIIAGEIE